MIQTCVQKREAKSEARHRWYDHAKRRESDYVGQRGLKMKLSGKRKVRYGTGRPKRSYEPYFHVNASGVHVDTKGMIKCKQLSLIFKEDPKFFEGIQL